MGPIVISFRIWDLEDQAREIRTGGDYTSVWICLAVGLGVYGFGAAFATGNDREEIRNSNRVLRYMLWTGLQTAVVLVAVLLAPSKPWS